MPVAAVADIVATSAASLNTMACADDVPLNKKGAKIKAAMEKQYGKERGDRVFYAAERETERQREKKKERERHRES